jgi:hypothetical protein
MGAALAFTVHFLLLISLLAIGLRSRSRLRAESDVLVEFGAPLSLATLVLLYPIAPLLIILGPFVLPSWLSYFLAIGCFVPALLRIRAANYVLERAGTDRVKMAVAAVSLASTGAITGLVYVAAFLAIHFAAGALVQVA